MSGAQHERLGLYGEMTVTVYDVKRGKTVQLYRIVKKNQITNIGRQIVLELLTQYSAGSIYQQNPEYNNIWSLSVGTDSTPPTLGDTGLGAAVWSGEFSLGAGERALDLVNFEVNITKEVPAGQATGSTITEAGLFTRGDNDDPGLATYRRLYARQVHPGIIKTATMFITYDWRLGVTIQT